MVESNEFDLFCLIQNPNATAATLQLQYLLPVPALPIVKTSTSDANSRVNIWVDREGSDLANTAVSAIITPGFGATSGPFSRKELPQAPPGCWLGGSSR